MTTETTIQGDVAIIAMNNPPVNGLGYETRVGITNALEKANADPAIKAIVLTGAGKAFSGGADIREFNSVKAMQEPILLSVILAVEHSQKPVVAAVHSVAMGGGLELALGCHYRIGAPGCKVALPEVKLGLIPGAGGTVRLPRVLGVEAALNMIVSGEPVNSELLAQLPGQKLFDQLSKSPESLLDEAVALARQVAAKHADGSPLPLVRNLPCKHKDGDAYFQFARNMVKGMAKNFPAPLKCVDAVENATRMKFDDALAKEREIFINLMQTPECKALRHIFAAERAASKIPDVGPEVKPRDIQKVAVIGAGIFGRVFQFLDGQAQRLGYGLGGVGPFQNRLLGKLGRNDFKQAVAGVRQYFIVYRAFDNFAFVFQRVVLEGHAYPCRHFLELGQVKLRERVQDNEGGKQQRNKVGVGDKPTF